MRTKFRGTMEGLVLKCAEFRNGISGLQVSHVVYLVQVKEPERYRVWSKLIRIRMVPRSQLGIGYMEKKHRESTKWFQQFTNLIEADEYFLNLKRKLQRLKFMEITKWVTPTRH